MGAYGERVAVRHLLDQGMVLLARNWRCPSGEIDAILRDRDTVVFVEVKTRRGEGFGSPASAVGPAKVARLRRLAAQWLAETGIHSGEVRFDVVEVRTRRAGAAAVEHLRGAF
ncbi:YraN family protein [Rugosimonospora acidiphila]|uniref:UPF0102 protein GCM10023322_17790 n=1 Tax=Rugosimonospora acidiphila TaxID=556531 RepID=A0ABP9RP15_9ACTN